MSRDNTDHASRDKVRAELTSQFPDHDTATMNAVLDKMDQARQEEELKDLHWDDPTKLADHIHRFSQGQGLQVGWNRWIGIQDPLDSSRYSL